MTVRLVGTSGAGRVLTFLVALDDHREYEVDVICQDSRATFVRSELSDEMRYRRSGGIRPEEPRLPLDVAYAVERELTRLWSDDRARSDLQTAGFHESPVTSLGKSGRPAISAALRAARARRALEAGGAQSEKELNLARDAGVLKRPPHAREFTLIGAAALWGVDQARRRLSEGSDAAELRLDLGDQIVEAALWELGQDGG